MCKYYSMLRALMAAFVITFAAVPTSALEVTLNGNRVFYDDYESRAPGPTFGVPSPSVASWGLNFRDGNNVSIVNDAAPGPVEGAQYGRLQRVVSNRHSFAAAQFNTPVAEGDALHAEWMMYIPSGQPQFGFNGGFEDVLENRAVAISSGTDGDVFATNEGLFWYDSGLDFAFDTWQKWEQDWVVGSANQTVTVAGNSLTLSNADPGGTAPITHFYFSTVNGSNFYVDAVPQAPATSVPEPTGVVLATIGLLGLVHRTIRSRRALDDSSMQQ